MVGLLTSTSVAAVLFPTVAEVSALIVLVYICTVLYGCKYVVSIETCG